MRKITMWFLATIAAVVLLFSYRTSTGPDSSPSAETVGGAGAAGVENGPGAAADPRTSRGTVARSGSTTVADGPAVQTKRGRVQVQAHISGGRITDITPLTVPSTNNRDREINKYAVPKLRAEALAAQSAQIDAVSGATLTSGGYTKSLQAALDSAQFTAKP
ncbi:FMN-binding protein [Micromonospora inositola]|uniref:FMN-binding domain-containing protein n=1 Tax=Micromonospora inositola TaxID=47865 RepID=A0A1C5IV39_9ACTN|nr:FMN-binding protein [Micromonospora inositola]SCG61881.1 FMN-binding domain-containing protein [Micromonospora inositola]